MTPYSIIQKKRDGHPLTQTEIQYFINGFVCGEIRDYQMAAFLMAVYFKGMDSDECVHLTMSMATSGETADLSGIDGVKVDKHSTGGVGDKTTLALVPLVAACGGIVGKMTGRELGHTGGTVDKLESIPGMKLDLETQQFIENVNRIHAGLVAQTANLAPADKLIYALRNVTATVDSIPLIAASVMSKKIAAGADAIVLDVKTGAGAFTPVYEDALSLAKTMVAIGTGAGRKVIAHITGMEQPLGKAVGNSIEVQEAIGMLAGKGPRDLDELVAVLGSDMLVLSGVAHTTAEAMERIEDSISSGKALCKMGEMIAAQGGDLRVIDSPERLPQPKEKVEILAAESGYLTQLNAMGVGMASKLLGSGRKTKEDRVDRSVGILLNRKIGDRVDRGEILAIFYTDGDPQKIDLARGTFLDACRIGEEQIQPPKMFYARVTDTVIEEDPSFKQISDIGYK